MMRKDDMKSVSKGSGRARGLRNKPMNGGGGGVRRGGGGSHNNYFDSNGPGSVRIRGSATQIYDRYMGLARDSSQGGDRAYSENLYQHAEHYLRVQGGKVSTGGGRPPRRDQQVSSPRGGKGRSLPKTRFEQDDYPSRDERESEDRARVSSSRERSYTSEESEEDEDKQGLLDFLGGFDSK
jgi:hypothetical protein